MKHILGQLRVAETARFQFDRARAIRAVNEGTEHGAAAIVGLGEANAERLVACWNALDGIPTEALKNFRLQHFAQMIRDSVNADELFSDETRAELEALCGEG